ncbi:hypothetical protein BDW02DRAFT_249773 [Decorospora gaudefroyi]|uniref:Transposase Tc1-like domain-containing protein n=1 Tax=Decorospora gaudefroyi TaxID=184978 RepID=A0A6A5KKK6_9PLEO|nr:hypothetical protein BDW02DRAFT_249773 [Decorospora gaudefroyi]
MLSSDLSQLPSTPRKQFFTSRDDRLRAQTLAKAGLPISSISHQTGLSSRQEQIQELILFVRSSRATSQMSCLALSIHFSHWGVSEHQIRYALQEAGYIRRIARAKSPLLGEQAGSLTVGKRSC